jgi:hypothetical protein
MEKLVCDKCGFELDQREDIVLALDGTEAWQDACRRRGEEPRGVFPCKYYFQCKGEMILLKDQKKNKGFLRQKK